MADQDLPPISQDLNDPLPQVDPNSDLVPYRTASNLPGQSPQVTAGYAPRARPPIQPPEGFGGGVGMPSLDRIYQAAFSKLPVDEAVKAVDAATRYIGQRGYQKDLASGMNAAQAFAKWGPTLFKQATGIPESIERSVAPPISPQQLIVNRLNQAKFDAAQAAAKQKADEGDLRTVGGVLYRVKPGQEPTALTKPPVAKPEPLSLSQQEEIKDAYKEQDEARKDMAKAATKDITSDEVTDARIRLNDAQKRIAAFKNPAQTAPASPFKEGQIVKNKKDGKRYKIVNGQPVELKE